MNHASAFAPRHRAPEICAVLAIAVVAGIAAATDWRVALACALAGPALVVLRVKPELLLAVVTIEMLFGGHGHLFDAGGLSLRQALSALALGLWALNRLLDGDGRLVGGRFAWIAVACVTLHVVGGLVSTARGNPDALRESATGLFLLLFFPLADIARQRGGWERLVRAFLLATGLLAVTQVVLSVGTSVGWIPTHPLALMLHLRFGGVTRVSSSFVRVFLTGSFFFQIALPLCLAGVVCRTPVLSRRMDLLLAALIVVALGLSYTRAFWIMSVIGCLALYVAVSSPARARMLAFVLLAVVAVLALPASALDPVRAGLDRLFSGLASADQDVSVAFRRELYPKLLAGIAERPFFGYGFGSQLLGVAYYENSYLYYLVKLGFVGFSVVLAAWGLAVVEAWRLARRGTDARRRALGAGLFAGTVSTLLVTAINPFINSPMGYFFQASLLAVLYGASAEATRGTPADGCHAVP